MQIYNSSREDILTAVRHHVPKAVEHPVIPVYRRTGTLKALFQEHLQKAGGAAHDVESAAGAESMLAQLHPTAKVICSAVPEIPGIRRIETIHDPHELADVDVGVVRAQFGIAESGAVWLTQEDPVVNSLGFLSQHLVVLLDPGQLVADMHEAYRRMRLDLTAYGCFMMGPSATADVEATLVHGAQGARSINVLFLAGSSAT